MSPNTIKCLEGLALKTAKSIILQNHYAHNLPSGKSYYYDYQSAIVVFSIPANKNISFFLLKDKSAIVWELSRLWAPNNHDPNLLTRAISKTSRSLRMLIPNLDAIVSYADPNIGHTGGVYKAASWIFHGQSEESRYYRRLSDNQTFSRRRFHSGKRSMKKEEIELMGYVQEKRPGKLRFVKPVSRFAKKYFKTNK